MAPTIVVPHWMDTIAQAGSLARDGRLIEAWRLAHGINDQRSRAEALLDVLEFVREVAI